VSEAANVTPTTMWHTRIGRLRLVALIEAVSYLCLLGIGMPLKYLAGVPFPLKVMGWTHGLLFIVFCFALLFAMLHHKWSLPKAALVFIASLIPFGSFAIDGRLQREDQAS
jgi:integral membrane protein